MRPFGSSVVLAGVVASLALAPACTCARTSNGGGEGASPADAAASSSDGGTAAPAASSQVSAQASVSGEGTGSLRLSAPIAATTTRAGAVFVAGLDAERGVVVLARLREGDGEPTWKRDVLTGVKWSPGVSLHVQPAGDRVAVLWRGPRGGASVKQAAVLDADGTSHGGIIDVGALACATESGLTWIDAAAKGEPRVRMQVGDAPPMELAPLSADREPELLCGPRRAFVSARGDDDVTLMVAGSDGKLIVPKLLLSRAADFPREEEREHATYVAGDDFGIVRLGETGGLSLREMRHGALVPWKKLPAKLTPDDDLVALDADERAVVLVYTRDASDACHGAGAARAATSVHALVIERASLKVSSVDLAAGECGKDVGPFAVGRADGALVPVWAERTLRAEMRAEKADPAVTAPIGGFAFRRIAPGGLGPLERRAQPADAVADAGCDTRGCRVIALARAPNDVSRDGMSPGSIRVFGYR